ncbi:NADPH-dependent FMN reductase [Streptosporangium subroseum]|uniref:NADPH-dependent FMN reductase n=1 Tax=Streptosporangium subroseum TaxID=106412 RepID=UPI0030881980|nr:NAD(P)H-dependent oxidoreductase [Streptosporangium subroseum]
MPLLKVIVAITRPGRVGRVGRNIGAWFARHSVEHDGFTVEIVDLAEVGLPFLDEPEHPVTGNYLHQHSKDWSAIIGEADAFVFVLPEYNYTFSAPPTVLLGSDISRTKRLVGWERP